MLHTSYMKEFEMYRHHRSDGVNKRNRDENTGMDDDVEINNTESDEEAEMDEIFIAFDNLTRRKVCYHVQQNGDGSHQTDSISSGGYQGFQPNRAVVFSILVAALGSIASTLFLGFGISTANREQNVEFTLRATEFIEHFQAAWRDYETGSVWLHSACRTNNITRQEFRDAYDHVTSIGYDIQAAEWIPKISRDQREALELESEAFYAENYPDIDYRGIVGFEPDPESETGLSIQIRSEQDFYYPVHFVEPVEPNQKAIGLDLYSSAARKETIELALDTWKPAVSSRLNIVQDSHHSGYSVLLMHPGIPLSSRPELEPKDLSLLVIRIHGLLVRAAQRQFGSMSIYVYDSTNNDEFLGAAAVYNSDQYHDELKIQFLSELSLDDLHESIYDSYRFIELDTDIASAKWTLVAVALPDTFEPNLKTIILAAIIIFVCCLFLAVWIYTTMRRIQHMNLMKLQSDAEKAAMVVDTAKKHARAEQELNDYIAHEVRNPLAAAMTACSFVKTHFYEEQPKTDKETMKCVREDVNIVDSSLRFINDLLRSMLDMHRAQSYQLKIELVPMDLLQDILEPVAAMLHCRDEEFDVKINCPKNLVVMTDRLRLKQIVLNLGRNSTKFVNKGYIQLGASVKSDGNVQVFVEDSGPGIPKEKRNNLFSKFQESLDTLDQGTGMGLCLCKNMAKVLNGDLWLDESFDSGVEGRPGTRFVMDLNIPPMSGDQYEAFLHDKNESEKTKLGLKPIKKKPIRKNETITSQVEKTALIETPKNTMDVNPAELEPQDDEIQDLPEKFSILFVDDDLILRKLFTRSVRKVVTGWNIQEAANGETALRLVEDTQFDLIFMDQYMASVEKQLLGTETVRALRAKGVTSRICGLSANDVEKGFLNAGADFFMFKPFPCEKDSLKRELLRIIYDTPMKRDSPTGNKQVGGFDPDKSTTSTVADASSSSDPGDRLTIEDQNV